ncbi:MAG: hypothetical protein HC883_02970 [Bdellovibrionaceae bacterium]|nr:hypothetical protein [Pseudobdellovibrionaceae bacterium]
MNRDLYSSYIDVNYHSVEIIRDGSHYLGVAAFQADLSRPFSFQVVGLHRGTISIRSRECGLDETRYYSRTGPVSFLIQPKERCLLSITMMPEFTIEESSGRPWRGLTGLILIRGSSNSDVRAVQLKFTSFYQYDFELSESSRLYLSGCGVSVNTIYRPGYGTEKILDEIDEDGGECVVDGFRLGAFGSRVDVALLLSRYGFGITRLAVPEVRFSGSHILVSADISVSWMSFNDEDLFANSARFKLASGVLRLYTSSGRSMFCLISRSEASCFR